MKWRFENVSVSSIDFAFLYGHTLIVSQVKILMKYAADMVISDLMVISEDKDSEIINEIEFHKCQARRIIPDIQNNTFFNVLSTILSHIRVR